MQQTYDLLAQRWQEQLNHVTELSLRLHSIEDEDPMAASLIAAYEGQLVVARAALEQLESRLARVPRPVGAL